MRLFDVYKVKHNGMDITDNVLSFTRTANICEGKEDLELHLKSEYGLSNVNIFDKIEIFEDGNLVKTFWVDDVRRQVPPDELVVMASDIKRIRDYFIAENYIVDYPSTPRYWITKFIHEAGASVTFKTPSTGGFLSNNTSLGLVSLYEQLQVLLQIAGWYMTTDNVGNIVIGDLLADHTPTSTIRKVLNFSREKDDHIMRNRVVVWGSGSKGNDRWVFADLRTHTPWQIDGNDWRTVVVANSNIPTRSEAYRIGSKALKEFAVISDIKVATVPGYSSLNLGDTILLDIPDWGFRGIVKLTSYQKSVSDKGAIEILTFDERCPRLFAYWGWGYDYIYIATNSGIQRKPMITYSGEHYLWEDYSQGIPEEDRFMTRVKVRNGNLISISESGNAYYRNTIDDYWVPMDIDDAITGGISGQFDSIYVASSGEIRRFDLFGRYIETINPLPSGEYIVDLDSVIDTYFLSIKDYRQHSKNSYNWFFLNKINKYEITEEGIGVDYPYFMFSNIAKKVINSIRVHDDQEDAVFPYMEKFKCKQKFYNSYPIVVFGKAYSEIYGDYSGNYYYKVTECLTSTEKQISISNYTVDGQLIYDNQSFLSFDGYIYGLYHDDTSKFILKYYPGSNVAYKVADINVDSVIAQFYNPNSNITWGTVITTNNNNKYIYHQKCNLSSGGCSESYYEIDDDIYDRIESKTFVAYIKTYVENNNSYLKYLLFDVDGIVEDKEILLLSVDGYCPSSIHDYEYKIGYDILNKRTVGIIYRKMFRSLPDNSDTDYACDEWFQKISTDYDTNKWNANPYFILILDEKGLDVINYLSYNHYQPVKWLPSKDFVFQRSVPGGYCGYGNKMRTPGTHITSIEFANDDNYLWLKLKIRGWSDVLSYQYSSFNCDGSKPDSGTLHEYVIYANVSLGNVYYFPSQVPLMVRCILFNECSTEYINEYLKERAIGAADIIEYYKDNLNQNSPYSFSDIRFEPNYEHFISRLTIHLNNGEKIYTVSDSAFPVYEGTDFADCSYCSGVVDSLVFGHGYGVGGGYLTILLNTHNLNEYSLYRFTSENEYELFDTYIVPSGTILKLSVGQVYPIVYTQYGSPIHFVSYDYNTHIGLFNTGMATFPVEGENTTLSGIIDRGIFSIGTTKEKLFFSTFSGIINNESMYNYDDEFDVPITSSGYYLDKYRLMESTNFTIEVDQDTGKLVISNGISEIFENYEGKLDKFQDVWENLDDFGIENINFIAVDDDL